MDGAKSVERGSQKVFATESHDHEGLARALGLARGEYEIKAWWKFGVVAVNQIQAEIQVGSAQLGGTLSKLMQLNAPNLRVTAECFPYGILNPEFRLQVNLEKTE